MKSHGNNFVVFLLSRLIEHVEIDTKNIWNYSVQFAVFSGNIAHPEIVVVD